MWRRGKQGYWVGIDLESMNVGHALGFATIVLSIARNVEYALKDLITTAFG